MSHTFERAGSAAFAAQLISVSTRMLASEDAFSAQRPITQHSAASNLPPAPAESAAATAAAAAAPREVLDFRCLNGLRALSSIAVVLFHCWLSLWTALLPFETTSQLSRHHWLANTARMGGPLGVEFFLITTAMLCTYQLLPLLEGTCANSSCSGSMGPATAAQRPSCGRTVLGYWRRRALRLLPAYAAANLLILTALGPREGLSPEAAVARNFAFGACPSGLWRNALFITNADISKGCGVHLWSLSVQVQFYAFFPLALCALRPRAPGFRARLAAALAATFALGTVWRLQQAFSAQGMHLPYGDITQPAELEAYRALLTASYFPTGTRVAELALGAALGLLLRSHAALSWVMRRRALLGAAALGLQAALLHTLLAWSPQGVTGEALWSPLFTRLYTALAYWGSPLVALTVAVSLLALLLHSDPIHSALASALGSPLFTPLSQLSYCLYLVHEQARLWAILYLLPAGLLPSLLSAAPMLGLALLTLLTLAAGYACAALLHTLVERRF